MASESIPKRKFEECLTEGDDSGKTLVEVVKDGMEILRAAMEGNTVTFYENSYVVALQLMKKMAHKLRAEGKKILIVFLSPEIHLVIEQAEVISKNTDLKVAHTYGKKCADCWNAQRWKTEITLNEVLVTTPQILLDSLQFSFVSLDLVDLLIFDKCDQALGQNSYVKIMEDYYSRCQHKPKVFGMTASPHIGKVVSLNTDCEDQIGKLKDIFDSKVYTLHDRAKVDIFAPTPNQITRFYSKPSSLHDSLNVKLIALRDKEIQECLSHHQFPDEENIMMKSKKKFEKIHGNIMYCLENLGLFCAYKAVQLYFEKALKKMQTSKYAFLTNALELLKQALPAEMDKLFGTMEGILDAVKSGLLTPKVHLLVHLIFEQRVAEKMHCIIFVERVIIAAVISSLMEQLVFLSFVPSDNSHRAIFAFCEKQQKNMRYVLTGKVNVLIATDAVEEDIGMQNFSCVIRFDLPKSVWSFIQSRGHARESNSNFIILLERGNKEQQKLLYEIIKSEESMKVMSLNIDSNQTPCTQEKTTVEPGACCVSSTGATITCDSSVKVNSRTFADPIVDESDNALVDNANDISNQIESPDGGLASEVSTHHGTGKNSLQCSQSVSSPVILQNVHTQGGPRTALYEICRKKGWHAPVFDVVEEQGLPHVRRFLCSVHIPGTEFVKVCGKTKKSKKIALDSASLQMLCEFQKSEICQGLDLDQIPKELV